MSTVDTGTYAAWYDHFLGLSGPKAARAEVASLPRPLSSGWRETVERAASVVRRRGPTWADVADALYNIPTEGARSTDGHVCSTCLTSYADRPNRGGVGERRLMSRVWSVGPDGQPDPSTRGRDGAPYGPPSSERPVTPRTDATGAVLSFDGYIVARQNACSVCRGFDGEERRKLLTDGGLTAYREAVAAAWSDRDAREAQAAERAAEDARKADERARKAIERAEAKAADAARKASKADTDRARAVARLERAKRDFEAAARAVASFDPDDGHGTTPPTDGAE